MKHSGFSLIELVVAIGVISFAIVGTFGLVSVAIQTSKDSADDLALSLMTEAAVTMIRSAGYDQALSAFPTGNSTSFFFDRDGNLSVENTGLPSTNAKPDSIFGCTISIQTTTPNLPKEMMLLQLRFTWPLTAPDANRQARSVLMSLGNHE